MLYVVMSLHLERRDWLRARSSGKREIQHNSDIWATFKPCICSGWKTATTRPDVLPSAFFGRHSSQSVTRLSCLQTHVFVVDERRPRQDQTCFRQRSLDDILLSLSHVWAAFKPCICSGWKTATTRLDVLLSTFFGRHSSQPATSVTPAERFAHVFFKVGTTPTVWTWRCRLSDSYNRAGWILIKIKMLIHFIYQKLLLGDSNLMP